MSGARDRSCSLVVSCSPLRGSARHMMESSMQGIEVLIVDPHQLWCEG